jgi:hypothetical protein
MHYIFPTRAAIVSWSTTDNIGGSDIGDDGARGDLVDRGASSISPWSIPSAGDAHQPRQIDKGPLSALVATHEEDDVGGQRRRWC